MEENTKETKLENKAEDKPESTGFQYEDGSKLRPCKHCGVMIPQKAKICPNCKLPQKGKFGRVLTILLVVIIVAWAFGMVYLLNSGDMDARFAHLFHRESVTAGAPVQTETTSEAAEEAAKETVKETGTEDIKVPAETEDILSIPVSGEELLAKGEKAEDTAETDVKEDGTESDTSKEADAENDADKESGAEGITGTDALREAIEETGSLLKLEESEENASETGSDKEPETDTEDMADAEVKTAAEDTAGAEASDDIEMTRLVNAGDYTEEEFRELCTKIGYKKLLREKEEYLGAALMLEVTVVSQVDGGLFDDNIYYLCKETDEQGIERYYILRDDRAKEETVNTENEAPNEEAVLILEGDRLLVYGQLFDSCKLPAYLMTSRPVVPAISMVYLDIEE